MTDPVIVLPAAGASLRMGGRDKLLEDVEGEPLLRRQVRVALTAGLPVAVTLDPARLDRIAALEGLRIERLWITNAAEGMSASIRAAAAWAGTRPLCIIVPDVPGVGAPEVAAVLDGFRRAPDAPVRASDPDGRPGTPLVVPPRLLPRLAEATGDQGGREALRGEAVTLLRFEDTRATRDLDTPEDWAAWRADHT